MTNLLMSEARRALHRRAVWVLIGIALTGIALLGVIAFTDSAGRSVAELGRDGTHPALMADWWVAGSADGILMVAGLPLLLGGIMGGATVLGAEWRAGTITTALTWEPRRLRLHAARLTSAFALAAVIAFVLEALFLLATVPAVLANGSTAGTDRGWWIALVAAMARIALLTGLAAVLAGSLATIGRGATFALGAIFTWVAVIENLVRGLKPALQPHLIGDNISMVVTWAQLDGVDFTRDIHIAVAAVVVYCGLVAAAGAATFARRDIAGAG